MYHMDAEPMISEEAIWDRIFGKQLFQRGPRAAHVSTEGCCAAIL